MAVKYFRRGSTRARIGNAWKTPHGFDDQPVMTRNIGTQEIFALDWQAP